MFLFYVLEEEVVEEEGVSYLIKHNETTSWTVVSVFPV